MSDTVQYLLGMIGAFSFVIVTIGVIRACQKEDTEPSPTLVAIAAIAALLLAVTVGVLIVVVIVQAVIP